jgi:hypothetical protein
MRSKGSCAIESVLGTADHDHARDRILRKTFWAPVPPRESTDAAGGDVISLAAFRATR